MSKSRPSLNLVNPPVGTAENPSLDTALERIAELERQNTKLSKINEALINRVEQNADFQGNSFSLFQTAILLEKQVKDRTDELHHTLLELEQSNLSLVNAKEEADTAHNRLSEAIEALSEGFSLFDADNRLVLFNSRFCSLFPELMDLIEVGTSFKDFLIAAYERGVLIVPKAKVLEWVDNRMSMNSSPRNPTVLALAGDRWIQVSERLTRHGEVVGIYTDVTAIKKSEAERREKAIGEKSLQLRATLDNLVQGVSVIDSSRRFAYWNGRFLQLMGLPPDFIREGMLFDTVLKSSCIKKAFPNSLIESDWADWSKPKNIRRLFQAEYRRQDGLVVEIQRKEMPDGGFVSTYTDVTEKHLAANTLIDAKSTLERRVHERTKELTELNRQLRIAKVMSEKANLSKTKFLAAASHDLLQPLNAARLFVSAFPETGVSPNALRLVERINTALASVDELLNALFEISKLDSGHAGPALSDFSVGELLSALESEYCDRARAKGLTLRVIPCSAVVRSDVFLLRRIVQNFVSNALHYTIQGKVLVGCRHHDKHLSIEVWDSGPGIPTERRSKIFGEFQRFAPPGFESDNGFGLGLAIAQRSAALLSYPIQLRSEVGKGSVFSISVPRGKAQKHPKQAETRRSLTAQDLSNATIVFVDNDDNNLEGMTALLTKWLYNVICVRDAQTAKQKIEELGVVPDLIIADYHLDDGRVGLDAIREICKHCNMPIPGFVITADHNDDVLKSVKSAGFELLFKPVKPAELRSLIAHALT